MATLGIAALLWTSITLSVVSSQLLATDPDYVSKVEKAMAAVISDHLGSDPAEFVNMFKYVLQNRLDNLGPQGFLTSSSAF